MRPVPLYNLKQGINRLRIKGGANPSSLYDLVNGWITVDGSVDPREGTIRAETLDGTTHGLMADNGIFNVFSIAQEAVPSGYLDNILVPPTTTVETAAATFAFTQAFNSISALAFVGGSLGNGWASGTTNGGNAFGNLTSTPNPPVFGGGNVAALSWDSGGSFNNQIALIISGALAQAAFDKIVITVAGGQVVTLQSSAATFSTSLLAGFTTWLWPAPSGDPFAGHTNTSVTIFTATVTTPDIKTIWFAKPFMGFPYVVAEFVGGMVQHYWLQNSGTWAPNTIYFNGTLILPTVSTGLAYLAQRVSPVNPTWQPETGIAVNTIIEPTEYTGFQYKAVAVAGSAPHTGSTEPVWPIVAAAILQEFGDFDTSSTDAGTTQDTTSTAQPLSTTITDRYGDSQTIASAGQTAGNTLTLPTIASTAVTVWAKGTVYAPGAVVQPSTTQGGFVNAIPNGDFENGNDGNWILSGGTTFNNTNEYQGNECLQFTANHGDETATMNTFGLVTPGQSVTATAYFNPNNAGANLSMGINLRWYDATDTFLSQTNGPREEGGGYRLSSVTGIAPANAKHCRVRLDGGNNTSAHTGFADLVSWNLSTPAAVSNFLFEAVQATAGTSGSTEPVWPTVSGNTVIDNTVTWKAIGTSIITWEAIPIMQSGTTEPVWPTSVPLAVHDTSSFVDQNGATIDTSISWIASSRQVTDPKNPNTTAVALNSSHVFAVDKDIVPFSAAVDPTDWTSPNNAGYLPTGLNNYGDNPAAVLALYRSNLMVFNSGGYQMWQTDPDPANMALLDAQPVGSIYTRGAQSVANDLLFITEVGIRNLATVGATANMQVGSSGQPVDPIVKALLKANAFIPISLYYPGKGQYWAFWGPQAIVFTVNGQGLRTWSRYIFPDTITDWTLNAGILYLRTAGNLVWQLDADTLVDDFGGANTPFLGIIQTPYVDAGPMGFDKELIGVDVIGEGQVTIQIGWAQNDPTTLNDNPGFSTSLNVTPPYVVDAADTVPAEPIPFPMTAPSFTLILTFSGNQKWSWNASSFYLQDQSGTPTG